MKLIGKMPGGLRICILQKETIDFVDGGREKIKDHKPPDAVENFTCDCFSKDE